jgi:predicted nucleic acid-binding Zn ribbon protein
MKFARTLMRTGYCRRVKTLVCPHCHTQVPESASVCVGCGAEVVRGLSRRQRSFVGLAFVAVAILIFGIFLRGYEIANGHPFLRSPKAEDGLLVVAGLILVVFLPYLVGIKVAGLCRRSRVRFFRSYQHQ